MEQSGKIGSLHWCLCGCYHKQKKYLCNILVSVCICQPTQYDKIYQGRGWNIHEVSEGPWYQYGNYAGPPEYK